MLQLWAIWTRLSILVPSPITVSRNAPQDAQWYSKALDAGVAMPRPEEELFAFSGGLESAVELLGNLMKPSPLRTVLFATVDIVTLGFLGLLSWFSIAIVERMHNQTMTVTTISEVDRGP